MCEEYSNLWHVREGGSRRARLVGGRRWAVDVEACSALEARGARERRLAADRVSWPAEDVW